MMEEGGHTYGWVLILVNDETNSFQELMLLIVVLH